MHCASATHFCFPVPAVTEHIITGVLEGGGGRGNLSKEVLFSPYLQSKSCRQARGGLRAPLLQTAAITPCSLPTGMAKHPSVVLSCPHAPCRAELQVEEEQILSSFHPTVGVWRDMGERKHPLKSLSPPGVVALSRRPRSQSLQGLGASLHPQVPPPPRCHQKLCLGSPVLGLPSENQRCPVTPPHTESPGGPGGNHLFPQRENLCLLPGRVWAMCFLCKRLKPEKKASRFRSLQLSPQNGFVQSACSTLKDAGRWLYRIDRVKSSACLGAQQASVEPGAASKEQRRN